MFKALELQGPISRLRSAGQYPFEFRIGCRLVQEMGSFVEGSKNPTTQTNTPKSMEELATKVMQVDKATELFQTMTIVRMNMGNLNLEVISLKKKLTTEEKEKVVLQLKLNKERDFKKEYKHNIEIQKKNKTKNEQRLKHSYKNCKIRIKSLRLSVATLALGSQPR